MNEKQLNSINVLTRAYYDYQRELMRLINQLGIKKNGEAKKKAPLKEEGYLSVLLERKKQIESLIQALEKELVSLIHLHPLWKVFLEDVKGCGEIMAAVIITQFDIHKADTVSKLCSFAGLCPGMKKGRKMKNGKPYETDEMIRMDKLTPGFLAPFNQFLRSKLIGVLGSGFLKSKSPYSEYYYNMKTRYENMDWGIASKNPVDKKKPKAGHQHNAAMRYMMKMFLKDLYVAWRTLENLDVRKPYEEEYLGKKHNTNRNE